MKKLSILFALFCASFLFSQSFVLTSGGFVNKDDTSKNFVVLDFQDQKQSALFKAAKIFINGYYNNPKFVSSEVENEQLVVNARSKEAIKVKPIGYKWDFNYNVQLSFKDGKVKVEFLFKDVVNPLGTESQPLIGASWGIGKTGLFNKEGKVLNEKAIKSSEEFANGYIENLKAGISKNLNSDW